MSIIITDGTGYAEKELLDNWAAEYAKRELNKHREEYIIDHPDNSISGEKIIDGAISNAKLASNAVASKNIQSGAITSDKIGSGAVTTEKLAGDAVTADKLADNAVATANIQVHAVTTDRLAYKSVTTNELGDKVVTTRTLADKCVTNYQIADNAVETYAIQNKAVTTAKIADGAATTSKLADQCVTAIKIADGTITHDKMAVEYARSAGQADTYTDTNLNALTTNGIYSVSSSTPKNHSYPHIYSAGDYNDTNAYWSSGTVIVCETDNGYTQIFVNDCDSTNTAKGMSAIAVRTKHDNHISQWYIVGNRQLKDVYKFSENKDPVISGAYMFDERLYCLGKIFVLLDDEHVSGTTSSIRITDDVSYNLSKAITPGIPYIAQVTKYSVSGADYEDGEIEIIGEVGEIGGRETAMKSKRTLITDPDFPEGDYSTILYREENSYEDPTLGLTETCNHYIRSGTKNDKAVWEKILTGTISSENTSFCGYSTTPVQVGTWIDGTPIWRKAFEYTFTAEDLSLFKEEKSASVSGIASLGGNPNNTAILGGVCWLRMSGQPCMIDDTQSTHISQACFMFPDLDTGYLNNFVADSSGFYGYVDYMDNGTA